MATINIGVVYDSLTKTVRRVIVPDSDDQLNTVRWHTNGDGEGYISMPSALATSVGAIQNFVTANVISVG